MNAYNGMPLLAASISISIAVATGCTSIADLGDYSEEEGSGATPGDGQTDAGRIRVDAAAADLDAAAVDTDAAAVDTDAAASLEDAGSRVDGGAPPVDVPVVAVEPVLDCSNTRTLCVKLTDFARHNGQMIQMDLVTSDDNVRSRVVLDTLDANRPEVVLPLAIGLSDDPTSLRLQMFADANDSRVYETGVDHDWHVPVTATGNVPFRHNTEFKPLDEVRVIGGDFSMHFINMDPHVGKMVEVMVIEKGTGRTVGLYRDSDVVDKEFTIEMYGIIEPGGVEYIVEAWGDLKDSDNGQYDEGKDHSWIVEQASDAEGLSIEFDHGGADIKRLTYQFPFAE